MYTPCIFPPFWQGKYFFVNSYFLSCTPIPFWKGVYSKRTEFTPTGWEQILSLSSKPFQTHNFGRVASLDITKTRLYNFDPLKPHFYIVKLGFTGVYIIFLISAQNIDCGYSLEPPRRVEAVLTSTHNLCFVQKYEKYQKFLSENFHFLVVKFPI